jgi:hypothetical protein
VLPDRGFKKCPQKLTKKSPQKFEMLTNRKPYKIMDRIIVMATCGQ